MSTIERILLYAVTLILGAVLFGGDFGLVSSWRAAGEETDRAAPQQDDDPVDVLSKTKTDSITVRDAQGRPRIELAVGWDGQPHIALKNVAGDNIIELSAGSFDSGEIVVRNGKRQASIRSELDGGVAVELLGKEQAFARLRLTDSDEAEVAVGSGNHSTNVVLRTDREGSAEVAIHSADGLGGPSMSLLANGDAGIRVTGPDGESGLVMQLFHDGLAEIAIEGAESKSGTSIVRMANGVSAVSVKLPNGNPGASMVVSPNGEAVISVTGPNGKPGAALRMDAQGQSGITLPDPPSKPEPPSNQSDKKPQPSKSPKRSFLSLQESEL